MNLRQGWMRLVVPVVAGVALGLLAVSLMWSIGHGIDAIQNVLWPLAMALLLAYVFDPLVCWLQRRWRWPRLVSTTILFAACIGIMVLLLVWMLPKALFQLGNLLGYLAAKTPLAADWVQRRLSSVGGGNALSQPDEQGFYQWWVSFVQTKSADMIGLARTSFSYAGQGLTLLFNVLTLVVLMPLYTFVFLWKFDRIKAWGDGWLPDRHRQRIRHVLGRIDVALSAFFRGRLIVCVIVGLLTGLAWWLVGLQFALVLGIVVGIFNLVPFLAFLVGLPIAVAVALVTGEPGNMTMLLALTIGTFTAIQMLDQFVLTPAIQGKAMGLHPVTIIVSLLIGSAWMGLLGVLLAVPAAAAIKILAEEWAAPWLRGFIHANAEAPPVTPPEQVEVEQEAEVQQ